MTLTGGDHRGKVQRSWSLLRALKHVVAHKSQLAVPSLAKPITDGWVSVITVWVLTCVHTFVYLCTCDCRCTCCVNCFLKIASHWCNFEVVWYLPEVFCHCSWCLWTYSVFKQASSTCVATLTFLKNRVDFLFFLACQPRGWGWGSFIVCSFVSGAEERMWLQGLITTPVTGHC